MADGFVETPVKGKHTTNAAAAGADTTAVLVLPAVANAAAPTYTEGNAVLVSTDLAGNLRTVLSGTNTVTTGTSDVRVVNGSSALTVTATDNTPLQVATYVGGTVVSAANALPTVVEVSGAPASATNPLAVTTSVGGAAVAAGNGLPTVIEVSGAPASAANPLAVTTSVGGTAVSAANALPTVVEVSGAPASAANALPVTTSVGGAAVTAANALPVTASVGGAAVSVTNPLFEVPVVRGAAVSDTNPLPVLLQVNPGALTDTYLTSTALAAGASVDLSDAALTGALVGKLVEVTADSSVRIKIVIKTVTSANVATTRRTFFSDPTGMPLLYKTSDVDTIVAPSLGNLRVTITNLDNINAADVYASITRTEV